jgi:hypothetical protein
MSANGQAPPREPHYVAAVEELLRRYGDQIRPGGLYNIQVAHDPWCPALREVPGVCCCNAVATLVEIGAGPGEGDGR